MSDIKTVLITGANAGLGRECARQLGQQKSIKKIYLACRNKDKAEEAKAALEQETGRKIFKIIIMDVMNLASVRDAVAKLDQPVDAVVLNAGGMGGKTPNALTVDGVTHMFAVNVLGHVVLVDELIRHGLLNSVVLYSGSEAARGIPRMGVARPEIKTGTIEEFTSIADGSKLASISDPMVAYGTVKLTAALWMSSMARQHADIRFVTMSPGGTTGTNGMDDLPFLKKVFFKHIGGVLMPLFNMMHSVDKGAKRYVDGLQDPQFKSGRFYASKSKSPTGPVIDQAAIWPTLNNQAFQDNAKQALQRFAS